MAKPWEMKISSIGVSNIIGCHILPDDALRPGIGIHQDHEAKYNSATDNPQKGFSPHGTQRELETLALTPPHNTACP